MSFLLVQLPQLCLAIICLNYFILTSAFNSSFFNLSCLLIFSISKFFSSMISLNFLILSYCISVLPFWDLLRFWIWAMDSLSYWFLSRWISICLIFSASLASSLRRVILILHSLPHWAICQFESGVPDLWCWDDRTPFASLIQLYWCYCIRYRIFVSRGRSRCFFAGLIWWGFRFPRRSGCFGLGVVQFSIRGPPSCRCSACGTSVPRWGKLPTTRVGET
jgi:hypothetical protein